MEHYIIITMVTGECQWSDLPLIKKMMTGCQSLFPASCGSPLAEASCTVLCVAPHWRKRVAQYLVWLPTGGSKLHLVLLSFQPSRSEFTLTFSTQTLSNAELISFCRRKHVGALECRYIEGGTAATHHSTAQDGCGGV